MKNWGLTQERKSKPQLSVTHRTLSTLTFRNVDVFFTQRRYTNVKRSRFKAKRPTFLCVNPPAWQPEPLRLHFFFITAISALWQCTFMRERRVLPTSAFHSGLPSFPGRARQSEAVRWGCTETRTKENDFTKKKQQKKKTQKKKKWGV